ncbi:MAG: hypothetical protein JWQ60_87 [Pseudonocardia sp.]|nr:hypothetical protein [Pseudonocardia sp.]
MSVSTHPETVVPPPEAASRWGAVSRWVGGG